MDHLVLNKKSISVNRNNEINSLRDFLERKVLEYNQPSFIPNDPISIPHQYSRRQDIEIAGFFAAILAWGNRTTIIRKCQELVDLMDHAPFEFIISHQESDLKRFLNFKHRTFNTTDLLYFIRFLQFHYKENALFNSGSEEASLESAFTIGVEKNDPTVENGLQAFYHYFFSLDNAPPRTKKHIASPENKSTCKRLNMYLRWMVRNDKTGVDFGLWKKIKPSQLICPVDLHVARVAKRFGMISRNQTDWLAAIELTEHLKKFDPNDPVKYDFALFGLGVMEKF